MFKVMNEYQMDYGLWGWGCRVSPKTWLCNYGSRHVGALAVKFDAMNTVTITLMSLFDGDSSRLANMTSTTTHRTTLRSPLNALVW